MQTRNIVTLAGAVLLSLGPVLAEAAPNTTLWWIGRIAQAIGGALMGYRAFDLDGKTPLPPTTPTK
jgi:hypothetical protein